MASIISCRCTDTSQAVIAGAVGDREMHKRQIARGHDSERRGRLASPRQHVEDHVIADRTGIERFANTAVDSVQSLGGDGGEHANEPPIGIVVTAQLAPQPSERE